jgi:hypothetical protein
VGIFANFGPASFAASSGFDPAKIQRQKNEKSPPHSEERGGRRAAFGQPGDNGKNYMSAGAVSW